MVSEEDDMWTQLFERQKNDIKTKDQMLSEQIEAFATQVMAMERHNSSHAEAARKAMCQMLRMAKYLMGEKRKETERANQNQQQIKDTHEQLRKQTEKLESALKEVETWRNKEEETRARGQTQTAVVETLKLRVLDAEQQRSECEEQLTGQIEIMRNKISQLKEYSDVRERELVACLEKEVLLRNRNDVLFEEIRKLDQLPVPICKSTNEESSFESTAEEALMEISSQTLEDQIGLEQKTDHTCVCDSCSKSFSDRSHLLEHVTICNNLRECKRAVVVVTRLYDPYCLVCDQFFTTPQGLDKHKMTKSHKRIKAFIKSSKKYAK